MPRPIIKRTTKSYKRDIEALTRLRTAIKLDRELDQNLAGSALTDIDKLIDSIWKLAELREPGR
jgi:hypothetical protein